MVSVLSRIYSTSLLSKLLRIVPGAPICISVTIMFHSFFISLTGSKYLSIFLQFLIFVLCSARTAKSNEWHVLSSFFFSLFFVNYHYVRILGSISFSLIKYVSYTNHLLVWSNFNLLHNSKLISFPSSGTYYCTTLVIVFCICLYNSLLHLCLYITYNCYSST